MRRRDEEAGATPMAHTGDGGALRDDPRAGEPGRGRTVLQGSLHPGGAGSDLAPLGGGQAVGPGAAVSGDRAADGRVDRDGDTGGALAAPRRGRLPAGARTGVLRVAVPVKGRLREPAFKLLEDAGL